jgi:hypothetical protein
MSRHATCRTVRDLLPLHAGGDLPSDKAVLVDEHLHACLTCFREFRDYAAMRGRLGVLAEEPLPEGVLDGFAEEVMACVALGEGGPAAALPSARRWRPDARVITRWAAAAALLLLSGAGLWKAGWLDPLLVTPPPAGSDTVADARLEPDAPRASEPQGRSLSPPAALHPLLDPSRGAGVLAGEGSGVRPHEEPGGWQRGSPIEIELLQLPDMPGGQIRIFHLMSPRVSQPSLLLPEPGRKLRPRDPLEASP